MKFRKKQKIESRHAKPLTGKSLSSNTYYRPRSTTLSSVKVSKKNSDTENKVSKYKIPSFSTISNAVIISIFVILIFFASTLSSMPNIKISSTSYKYRDDNTYQQTANNLLNSSFLNKSKIFFRSQNFEENMTNSFPEISEIEAIIPLGGRDLSVSMQLSTPLAIVTSGAEKGIVDTNGVLVTKDLPSENNLYSLRFTTPQDSFEVGSRIFTTDEVNQLRLLEAELSNIALKIGDKTVKGLSISDVLFNVSDGQFEVKMSELPYIIKISSYADGAEQVGAAKLTLINLQNKINQPPEKYLDVRVPGRVFVL